MTKQEHAESKARCEKAKGAPTISKESDLFGAHAPTDLPAALAEIEEDKAALEHIANILGTGSCTVNQCQGCDHEMGEAAQTARERIAGWEGAQVNGGGDERMRREALV